jgi:hypothetical protein
VNAVVEAISRVTAHSVEDPFGVLKGDLDIDTSGKKPLLTSVVLKERQAEKVSNWLQLVKEPTVVQSTEDKEREARLARFR